MIFTVFPLFTLSPRHPHSLCSIMTCFSPFILSYLSFLYLIFSRSHDQDGELGFIRIDYLQIQAPTRTHRGIVPRHGLLPGSQELPVLPQSLDCPCSHLVQLLRRRSPIQQRRPQIYRAPKSSLLLLLPCQVDHRSQCHG